MGGDELGAESVRRSGRAGESEAPKSEPRSSKPFSCTDPAAVGERFLSVVMMPKESFSASAKDVTRLEPPAFLLTTTASRQFGTFWRIHLAMMGSARRLSTGFWKNPCIGGA
jgi:hypothetical protein